MHSEDITTCGLAPEDTTVTSSFCDDMNTCALAHKSLPTAVHYGTVLLGLETPEEHPRDTSDTSQREGA